MSVSVVNGNIFNSHAQTLVNTVNCVGVMGKGIALVYKLRYPLMFDLYQQYCKQGLLCIGKLWLYKGEPNEPWVLNFPTKTHWKLPSEYSYIEKGLQKFVDTYREKGITSIAFPLLGVNNGGLDKEVVLKTMCNYLSQCDIPIEIYLYDPYSSDDLYELFKKRWQSISNEEKRTEIDLKNTQIKLIDEVLENNNVKSMITLLEYKGIGITTMQKCYKWIMKK